MTTERNKQHDIIGTALGVFCIFMLVSSPWQIDRDVEYPFYKGPFIMPIISLSIGVISALPSIFRLIFKKYGEEEVKISLVTSKTLLMLLVIVCYPITMKLFGPEFAAIIILSAELVLAGIRKPAVVLSVTLVVTLIFLLVFRILLDVYFPEPWILELVR